MLSLLKLSMNVNREQDGDKFTGHSLRKTVVRRINKHNLVHAKLNSAEILNHHIHPSKRKCKEKSDDVLVSTIQDTVENEVEVINPAFRDEDIPRSSLFTSDVKEVEKPNGSKWFGSRLAFVMCSDGYSIYLLSNSIQKSNTVSFQSESSGQSSTVNPVKNQCDAITSREIHVLPMVSVSSESMCHQSVLRDHILLSMDRNEIPAVLSDLLGYIPALSSTGCDSLFVDGRFRVQLLFNPFRSISDPIEGFSLQFNCSSKIFLSPSPHSLVADTKRLCCLEDSHESESRVKQGNLEIESNVIMQHFPKLNLRPASKVRIGASLALYCKQFLSNNSLLEKITELKSKLHRCQSSEMSKTDFHEDSSTVPRPSVSSTAESPRLFSYLAKNNKLRSVINSKGAQSSSFTIVSKTSNKLYKRVSDDLSAIRFAKPLVRRPPIRTNSDGPNNDLSPQIVEEYILESIDRPQMSLLSAFQPPQQRLCQTRLTIFHRLANDQYLGQLYVEHDFRVNENKGSTYTFNLGSRMNALRYIEQFTQVFRKEKRNLVRITRKDPNPRVQMTAAMRERLAAARRQQQQNQSQIPNSSSNVQQNATTSPSVQVGGEKSTQVNNNSNHLVTPVGDGKVIVTTTRPQQVILPQVQQVVATSSDLIQNKSSTAAPAIPMPIVLANSVSASSATVGAVSGCVASNNHPHQHVRVASQPILLYQYPQGHQNHHTVHQGQTITLSSGGVDPSTASQGQIVHIPQQQSIHPQPPISIGQVQVNSLPSSNEGLRIVKSGNRFLIVQSSPQSTASPSPITTPTSTAALLLNGSSVSQFTASFSPSTEHRSNCMHNNTPSTPLVVSSSPSTTSSTHAMIQPGSTSILQQRLQQSSENSHHTKTKVPMQMVGSGQLVRSQVDQQQIMTTQTPPPHPPSFHQDGGKILNPSNTPCNNNFNTINRSLMALNPIPPVSPIQPSTPHHQFQQNNQHAALSQHSPCGGAGGGTVSQDPTSSRSTPNRPSNDEDITLNRRWAATPSPSSFPVTVVPESPNGKINSQSQYGGGCSLSSSDSPSSFNTTPSSSSFPQVFPAPNTPSTPSTPTHQQHGMDSASTLSCSTQRQLTFLLPRTPDPSVMPGVGVASTSVTVPDNVILQQNKQQPTPPHHLSSNPVHLSFTHISPHVMNNEQQETSHPSSLNNAVDVHACPDEESGEDSAESAISAIMASLLKDSEQFEQQKQKNSGKRKMASAKEPQNGLAHMVTGEDSFLSPPHELIQSSCDIGGVQLVDECVGGNRSTARANIVNMLPTAPIPVEQCNNQSQSGLLCNGGGVDSSYPPLTPNHQVGNRNMNSVGSMGSSLPIQQQHSSSSVVSGFVENSDVLPGDQVSRLLMQAAAVTSSTSKSVVECSSSPTPLASSIGGQVSSEQKTCLIRREMHSSTPPITTSTSIHHQQTISSPNNTSSTFYRNGGCVYSGISGGVIVNQSPLHNSPVLTAPPPHSPVVNNNGSRKRSKPSSSTVMTMMNSLNSRQATPPTTPTPLNPSIMHESDSHISPHHKTCKVMSSPHEQQQIHSPFNSESSSSSNNLADSSQLTNSSVAVITSGSSTITLHQATPPPPTSSSLESPQHHSFSNGGGVGGASRRGGGGVTGQQQRVVAVGGQKMSTHGVVSTVNEMVGSSCPTTNGGAMVVQQSDGGFIVLQQQQQQPDVSNGLHPTKLLMERSDQQMLIGNGLSPVIVEPSSSSQPHVMSSSSGATTLLLSGMNGKTGVNHQFSSFSSTPIVSTNNNTIQTMEPILTFDLEQANSSNNNNNSSSSPIKCNSLQDNNRLVIHHHNQIHPQSPLTPSVSSSGCIVRSINTSDSSGGGSKTVIHGAIPGLHQPIVSQSSLVVSSSPQVFHQQSIGGSSQTGSQQIILQPQSALLTNSTPNNSQHHHNNPILNGVHPTSSSSPILVQVKSGQSASQPQHVQMLHQPQNNRNPHPTSQPQRIFIHLPPNTAAAGSSPSVSGGPHVHHLIQQSQMHHHQQNSLNNGSNKINH